MTETINHQHQPTAFHHHHNGKQKADQILQISISIENDELDDEDEQENNSESAENSAPEMPTKQRNDFNDVSSRISSTNGSSYPLGDSMEKKKFLCFPRSRLPSARIIFISVFLCAPFILFVLMLLSYYCLGE